MKKLIIRHTPTALYIITFAFSFVLIPLHFVFQSAGNYSISFTQLSPGLTVFLIAWILKDTIIIQDLKDHLLADSTVLKWGLFAIAVPSLGILISSILLSYLNIDYVAWTGDFLFYFLNTLAILIG